MSLLFNPHYQKIIAKAKSLVGYVDGKDLESIYKDIDDLTHNDGNKAHEDLVKDLRWLANAMMYEHGVENGKTQSWDYAIMEILDLLGESYQRDEEHLDKLLAIILHHNK